MSNATIAFPNLDDLVAGTETADKARDDAFLALDEVYKARRDEIMEAQRALNAKCSTLDAAYYTARDVIYREHSKQVSALAA